MTYKDRVQKKAEEMARVYFTQSEFIGKDLNRYKHKDGYIKRFLPLAEMAVKSEAEAYRAGAMHMILEAQLGYSQQKLTETLDRIAAFMGYIKTESNGE